MFSSETADRQIDYVRQLCVGNPRLQYLLGKHKMEATYTRTLDLTGFNRCYSDSDIYIYIYMYFFVSVIGRDEMCKLAHKLYSSSMSFLERYFRKQL